MVQISELSYASPQKEPIFSDFHLRVERGSLLCLVGEAGVGKTLLLSLLCREQWPTRGQILVAGRNIVRLSPEHFQHLRYQIGVVPQRPQPPLQRTLTALLRFRLRALDCPTAELEPRINGTLRAVGLSAQRDRPPAELAPGERRVFQLALALSSDPLLLLFDDPTSGLSPAEGRQVLETLRQVQQRRRLTVLATSRLSKTAELLDAPLVELPAPPRAGRS